MADLDGLTHTEYLVLEPLDDESPTPLWEIAENFVAGVVGDPPTTEHIADLLAPVLAAMAAHRLVEVRRFAGWPAAWDPGLPVPADRVAGESRPARLWSRDAPVREVHPVSRATRGTFLGGFRVVGSCPAGAGRPMPSTAVQMP